MKPIITFIKNLQFIFRPEYWIMDDTYNAAWDKKFCELVETHDFMPDQIYDPAEFGNKTYCALLGEYRIWASNYPYAFFGYFGKSNSSANSVLNARPSSPHHCQILQKARERSRKVQHHAPIN